MWICPSCDAVAVFQNERPWPVDWRCMSCGRAVEHRCGVPCLAPELIGSRSGFDPSFFQDLLRIEAANFWFVNRGRLILRLLDEHFPASRSLLEIGCGTGSVLGAIQERRPELCLIGSELHPEGIAIAARRLGQGVTLLQFDARAIPAREEFYVVGAFDVIEHIPEDETVLRAMRTCLRPGGGAIVTVPQHPWLWGPFDDVAQHCRPISPRGTRRETPRCRIRRSPFDVIQCSPPASDAGEPLVQKTWRSPPRCCPIRVQHRTMAKPHVESCLNSGDMADCSRRGLATRRQPV